MGLVIFVVSTLPLLHVIWFSNGLSTPPLRNLTFYIPILLPLCHGASQISVKLPPTDEDQLFERSALGPSLILARNFKSVCLPSVDCQFICDILEAGF